MVHRIKNDIPEIHESVFVASTAEVAGRVSLEEGSSVWFSASIRGDIAPIQIGKNTNIQDGAIIHCDENMPCVIGAGVTVGHKAVIHSASIGNNTLIGIGAIILSGSVIGENSIVGAGSLITGDKKFPPGSMIYGSPAKLIRRLTPEEIQANQANAQAYTKSARTAKNDYQDAETL